MMKIKTLVGTMALVSILGLGSSSAALAAQPFRVDFGPVFQNGLWVTDCGGFSVLADYATVGHYKIWFDSSGSPIKGFQHNRYDSVYYASDDPSRSLEGGPGEGEQAHVDFGESNFVISGVSFKITIPGYGVIAHEAGRTGLDLETMEVLFEIGPSDFYQQDLDALCEALSP